ncbi:MAG: CHAT domain-containing protein [Pirellulales bacterium]|nr:CHAT domain-containing protein [Pirellulales bacterium]
MFVSCVLIFSFAFSTAAESKVVAQEDAADAPTPEQQALLGKFEQQFGEFADLFNAGKLDEATAVGLEAVETSERIRPNRIETTVLLKALGNIYESQGDLQQALAMYRRHADITAANFGEDYYETADAHWTVKRFETLLALKPAEQEELLRAQQLERDAHTAFQKLNYAEAVQLADQALAIREKLLPTPNPQLLSLMRLLGQAHLRQRHLQEAAHYIPAALEMTETLYPEDKYPTRHPSLLDALINMAALQRDMGNMTRAHAELVRNLEVAEALYPPAFGPQPDVARSLGNLGFLEEEMGNYGSARIHLQRAIDLFEQIKDQIPASRPEIVAAKEHEIVTLKQHLGRTHYSLGEIDRAQEIYERDIAFLEKLNAADPTLPVQSELAQAYLYLADVFVYRQQFAEACAEGEKAVRIAEELYPVEKFPQGHPFLIGVWNAQSQLLDSANDLKASQEYASRALQVAEKLFSEESYPQGNFTFVSVLSNVGMLHLKTGELDQAEPYLARAWAICRKMYGSEFYPNGHPRLYGATQNYAMYQARSGNLSHALDLVLDASLMQFKATEDILGDVSEETMHRYVGEQQGATNLLLTLLGTVKNLSPSQIDRAYFMLTDRKTAVLDALFRFRGRQMAFADDEEMERLATELQAARQEQANRALNPAASEDLTDEIQSLEAQLNSRLSGSELAAPPKQVVIPEDLAQLDPACALVDIFRYHPFDFEKLARQPAHYGAIVLRGKPGSRHHFVDLGPAGPIDALVGQIRREVEQAGRALAVADEAEIEEQYKVPARKLYDLVVAPLEKSLDGATTLYLCPDGELTRIPFEALVDEKDKYLIESRAVSYISNSRALIVGNPERSQGTLVFAAPDFKFSGEAVPPSDELAALLRGAPEVEFRGAVPSDLRGLNWSPLPGTVKEAAAIAEILAKDKTYGPVVQVTGAAALEERLKGLKTSPRILHLATHGYYLPSQAAEAEQEVNTQGVERGGMSAAQGLGSLKKQENPLLRSGIVLAGANRQTSDDEAVASESRDDGWVTAEEIGMLKLRGTELVVLSACETGLGDLRTGEGVTGLRRAFAYAGASTLLTSLYKVPDEDTQKLMVDFYRGLAAGKSKSASLRDAELKAIADRRKSEGAAHPFFWASFILVGDPR